MKYALLLISALAFADEKPAEKAPEAHVTIEQRLTWVNARALLAENKLKTAELEKDLKAASDAIFAVCGTRGVTLRQSDSMPDCNQTPVAAKEEKK